MRDNVLIFFSFFCFGTPGGNGEDSSQKRVADSFSHWLLSEVLVDNALCQQDDKGKKDKGKWNEEDAGMTEEGDDADVHGEGEEEGKCEGDASA